MKKFLALMMVISMGVAACGDGNGNGGGGGGGGGGGSTIEDPAAEEQASALATQANESFNALADNPNSALAIGEVFSVYANALGVASAGNSAAVVAGNADAAYEGENSDVEACVTETANSVTWNNCNFNGYTLNGSITKSGDTLDLDLDIAFASVTVSFTGSLTVTATLVDGDFSVTSTVANQGFTLDVTFDQVVLTGGCPTSGTIFVDPSLSSAQIRSVLVEFGPNCGDVTLSEG